MSTLEAAGVWITDDRDRSLLEPTTVRVASGEVVLVHGDPGHRHTLLALALGGRIALGGGEVLLDGVADPARLHRTVALVDVPGVSEPDEVSALRTIVGEELAMAGKPAGRRQVESWLGSNSMWSHHRDRMEDLPGGVRTLALARLASLRPGVEFLVLAMPERSGVDRDAWLEAAQALADAGFGVVVTASDGLARIVAEEAPAIRSVPFGNAVFDEESDWVPPAATGAEAFPAPDLPLPADPPADPIPAEPGAGPDEEDPR